MGSTRIPSVQRSTILLHLLLASLAALIGIAAGQPEQPSPPLVELTAFNFDQMVTNGSAWFVMLYSPSCGHCKRLTPTLEQLARDYSGLSKIAVGKADCTEEAALGIRFSVRSFPKLLMIEGGRLPTFRTYAGGRSEEELKDYIEGDYLGVEGLQWSDLSNPMAPWVTWVFLLNPIRVLLLLLPFETGLVGNGVLLVSLMAAYVAIPCVVASTIVYLLCGINPCKEGGNGSGDDSELDREEQDARAATDAAARRAKLPSEELNELRKRAAQEGLSEESLEAAISAFANGEVMTRPQIPKTSKGKKKLSVRARAGDKKRS